MRISGPTFDSSDPIARAKFYEQLLGWPSQPGEPTMMMHLDIGVSDLDAGVRWAIEQGAVLAGHQPQLGVRVMIDPYGHTFCLFPDDFL